MSSSASLAVAVKPGDPAAPGIATHPGVIGVLAVNGQSDSGDVVYLRYDPAARETTKWNESCMAAFNDALAAVAAAVEYNLPVRESRFYAVDWQQVTTKTNIEFEGRSLTLAAALAIASYYGKFPLGHVLCTGDLSQDGRVLAVDPEGLEKKLQFVANGIVASQFRVLMIPASRETPLPDPAGFEIHRVKTLRQALKELGPDNFLIRPLGVNVSLNESAPGQQKSLLHMARVALAGGDVGEAIRIYDRLLGEDSRNAEAWFQKGLAILKLGGGDGYKPESLIAVATHLSLKNHRPMFMDPAQLIIAKAGVCLQEGMRINADYRSALMMMVSASWERLTGTYSAGIQEAVRLAVAPEDIKCLTRAIQSIDKILNAMRHQHKWLDPPSLLERLQKTWADVKEQAMARLKTLKVIEVDIKLALATGRLTKTLAGNASDLLRIGIYLGVFIFACYIFFVPLDGLLPISGALVLLGGLLLGLYLHSHAKNQQPPGPDPVKLWIKHGKKRGIEFDAVSPSGVTLPELNELLSYSVHEICFDKASPPRNNPPGNRVKAGV
ncbi:hypothetical protein HY522_01590 [bacterium]|nr:hypothetical protein [bacterium]